LSIVLIIVWPVLSTPAGVFSEAYFAFWVLVAIAWGFGSAIIITILPLSESHEEIGMVFTGLINWVTGREAHRAQDPNEVAKADALETTVHKEAESDDQPSKGEEVIIEM